MRFVVILATAVLTYPFCSSFNYGNFGIYTSIEINTFNIDIPFYVQDKFYPFIPLKVALPYQVFHFLVT